MFDLQAFFVDHFGPQSSGWTSFGSHFDPLAAIAQGLNFYWSFIFCPSLPVPNCGAEISNTVGASEPQSWHFIQFWAFWTFGSHFDPLLMKTQGRFLWQNWPPWWVVSRSGVTSVSGGGVPKYENFRMSWNIQICKNVWPTSILCWLFWAPKFWLNQLWQPFWPTCSDCLGSKFLLKLHILS